MPSPGRLARVLRPFPDEAFVSWVDRTALRLDLTRSLVLGDLGVTNGGRSAPAIGAELLPSQLAALEVTTGLDASWFDGMLLSRFRHTGVDFAGLDAAELKSVRSWTRWSWAFVLRSHGCPGCVESSGYWRTSWRSSWHFACPEHGAYLVDRCPACATPLYSRAGDARQVERCCGAGPAQEPTRADGRPRVRRSPADICGSPVRAMLAVPCNDDELLSLQGEVLERLHATGSSTEAAHRDLAALRSAMVLARYLGAMSLLEGRDAAVRDRFRKLVAERDDESPRKGVEGLRYRSYSRTPTDPLLVAAAVSLAGPLVLGPDTVGAAQRFVEASFDAAGGRARWVQLDKFWRAPPELEARVRAARDRRSFSLGAALDGRARDRVEAHPTLSWRNVPQLVWTPWLERMPAAVTATGWREHRRRYVSIVLARRLSPELSTWKAASVALGLGGEGEAASNRISRAARGEAGGAALLAVVDGLVRALEQVEEPIDYAGRRDALEDLVDLDPDDWEAVVGSSGLRMNRYWAARRPAAAAWVWVTATGGDFHFAPSLGLASLTGQQRGQAENRYRQYFLPAVVQIEPALRALAGSELHRRGIDGPLEQVPPLPHDG